MNGRTFPVRDVAIAARAEGGLALNTLTQSFANPNEELLKILDTQPLPADGAVLGLTIQLGR